MSFACICIWVYNKSTIPANWAKELEDYIEKSKETFITVPSNSYSNKRTNRETYQKLGNKNGKKNIPGYFKRKTAKMALEKTVTSLCWGNPKRETESILISTRNNARRINYAKMTNQNALQKSKYLWCDNRNETVHNILNEYSKRTKNSTRLGLWFLCLMAYQLFVGYSMPKQFS